MAVTYVKDQAEHWSIKMVRIGNQAVREAQARNRQQGITNWYSLNGRLVSDAMVSNKTEPKK